MTNHHDAIVTAGVDFASQASNTATCSITWTSAGAVITELTSSCDDNFILELVSRVTKVGIDVPLGWPSPFVEALRMHAHDGSWPANYEHVTNLKDYRLRSTDNWVHETLKLPLPLSVATDRIAIPTMRAAALFARITPRPPLDGSGRVIEVYPPPHLRVGASRQRATRARRTLSDAPRSSKTSRTRHLDGSSSPPSNELRASRMTMSLTR